MRIAVTTSSTRPVMSLCSRMAVGICMPARYDGLPVGHQINLGTPDPRGELRAKHQAAAELREVPNIRRPRTPADGRGDYGTPYGFSPRFSGGRFDFREFE